VFEKQDDILVLDPESRRRGARSLWRHSLLGATLCVGVAAMLSWHVVINIGMVVGVLPIVGVTLPLTSTGGSSFLTIMVALGL
jgi:cell division protein FtsW (lipid II flippase)